MIDDFFFDVFILPDMANIMILTRTAENTEGSPPADQPERGSPHETEGGLSDVETRVDDLMAPEKR